MAHSASIEFVPPKSIIISNDHLIHTCKYRQQECCRYVVYFNTIREFCCVKNILKLHDWIESENPKMVAKGNNCKGLVCDEEET